MLGCEVVMAAVRAFPEDQDLQGGLFIRDVVFICMYHVMYMM